jgi:tetratricopeptide (TPR) repeat protein
VGRAIALADGFVLLPVEVTSSHVGYELAAWLTQGGYAVELVEPGDADGWRGLVARLDALPDKAKANVVVVLGSDAATNVMGPGLRLLNQRRDSVARRLDRPLVWCGTKSFLDGTWQAAPDFWSVGDVTRRVEGLPVTGIAPLIEAFVPQVSADEPADPAETVDALARHYENAKAQGDVRNAARIGLQTVRRLNGGEDRGRAVALASEVLALLRPLLEAAPESADPRDRAALLGVAAELLDVRGEEDEAYRLRVEQQIPIYERLGDARGRADAMGKVAERLEVRGELEEAIQIRRHEQLPAYRLLANEMATAATLGAIASDLQRRQEYDEALRVRLHEELPIYQKLQNERAVAIAYTEIFFIYVFQGRLDEAMRVQRDQLLPMLRALGLEDFAPSIAGITSSILESSGKIDEALRILREDALPTLSRLGNERGAARTHAQIAHLLKKRGELDEALRLLRNEVLPVLQRLGDEVNLPFAINELAEVLQLRGELDEALRVRQDEQLPYYERIGDGENVASTLRKIADLHDARGDHDEAQRIRSTIVDPDHPSSVALPPGRTS